MYMTEKERRILNDARRLLSEVYPHIQLDSSTASLDVAALQFMVGSRRPGSRDVAALNPHRILLARMRVMHAPIEPTIVTWDIGGLESRLDMQWFRRIRDKYSSNWNGAGAWSHDKARFETTILAFHYAYAAMHPAVVPVNVLREMRDVYLKQESDAQAAAVRVRLSKRNEKTIKNEDELDQFIGASASARRETVMDGRGSCFYCGVPKPRGRRCEICGYTPRSAVRS